MSARAGVLIRCGALLAAPFVAIACLGAAAPAAVGPVSAETNGPGAGDGGGDRVTIDGGPADAVRLVPLGGSASWPVQVGVPKGRTASLSVALTASGPLARAPAASHVSATLASCTVPWSDGACAGTERVLNGPVPVVTLDGSPIPLTVPSSARLYLATALALDASAPESVQGLKARVRLTVVASGEDAATPPPGEGGGTGPAGGQESGGGTGPGGGPLADTGTRLLGAALLGLLAVGGGFAVTSVVERRRRRG